MKIVNFDFLNDMLKLKTYLTNDKITCAEIIKQKLLNLGFEVDIDVNNGAPIIYSTYDANKDKNILFYSHYDVKPEGEIRLWKTDPFEPYYDFVENKVYARGAGDAKGQLFAAIKGVEEALIEKLELSYNISFLFDGSEESGSVGLLEYCKKNLSELEYAAIIIFDSHWLFSNPVIYCGTRGQQSITISYENEAIAHNLHAGNYGGLISGAAREFIDILSIILKKAEKYIVELHPENNEYGNAISLTYINSGEYERSTIPYKAVAKIDVRFIDQTFSNYIKTILDEIRRKYRIEYEVIQSESDFFNAPEADYISMLSDTIRKITKKDVKIQNYCGAYLPLAKLQFVNGIKYVIPIAQADECNHVPNEKISLDHIMYGIEFVKTLICQNPKIVGANK